MPYGLSSLTLKKIMTGGFLKGLADGFSPKFYNMLTRSYDVANDDDTATIYHVGDFALPVRNDPGGITFEQPGGWVQNITGLDTYTKGIRTTEPMRTRIPEIVQRARALPGLFARKYDDEALLRLVEGDGTTYGGVPDGATPGTDISFFSGTGVGHVFPGDVSYKTAMLNLIAAAQVSTLNIADPTAPTAAEFRTASDGVIQYIEANIKDSAGNNLFTGGERRVLLVPPNMYAAAMDAFLSPIISTGGTNVYAKMSLFSDIITDSRLTDTAIFYIWYDVAPEKPLWVAKRKVDSQEFNFAMTDETSPDYVKSADRPLDYSVVAKKKFVYGDWRLMYRIVFS